SARRVCSDPVVAFGPNDTCWLCGCEGDFPAHGKLGNTSIKLCRSINVGMTWDKPISVAQADAGKNGKILFDKPWLAVDCSGGINQGTVYVAWTRIDFDVHVIELWCAALRPGRKQFETSIRLSEPFSLQGIRDGVHQVQLAIRQDGTLDAIWRQLPLRRLV